MMTNEEKIEICKNFINKIIKKNDIWIGKSKTGRVSHLLINGYTCQNGISLYYREPLNLKSNNITIILSEEYKCRYIPQGGTIYDFPSYFFSILFKNSSLCRTCKYKIDGFCNESMDDFLNIQHLPIYPCIYIVNGKRDPLSNKKKPDRPCRNTTRYPEQYYCYSHYKALLNKLLKVSTSSDICDIIMSYLE
jgi:hypothetical protein